MKKKNFNVNIFVNNLNELCKININELVIELVIAFAFALHLKRKDFLKDITAFLLHELICILFKTKNYILNGNDMKTTKKILSVILSAH